MMKILNKFSFLMAAMAVMALASCGSEDKTDPKPDDTVKIPEDTGERVSRVVETVTNHITNIIIPKKTYTYEYDAKKRVTKVQTNGSVTGTYKYEGNSKVTGNVKGKETTIDLGDRGQVLKINDSSGDVTVEYNGDYLVSEIKMLKTEKKIDDEKKTSSLVKQTHGNQGEVVKSSKFNCADDNATNCTDLNTEGTHKYSKTGILFDNWLANDYFILNSVFSTQLVSETVQVVYGVNEEDEDTTKIIKYSYKMDNEGRVTKWTIETYDSDGTTKLTTVVRDYDWKE